MSTRLPTAYQDSAAEQIATVSVDAKLAHQRTDPASAYHVGPETIAAPRAGKRAVTPYSVAHFDVSPVSSNYDWNRVIQFKVGHEGPALLHHIEAIFQVGAVAAGSFVKYQPYVGEMLIGDEFTVSYGTNAKLREYGRDELHFFRRLRSEFNSQDDAIYKSMVGSDVTMLDTQSAQEFVLPLDLMNDGSVDNCLITGGLAQPLSVSWRLPTFASLLTRGGTSADGVAAGQAALAPAAATLTVYLRVYYIEVGQAERAALIFRTMKGAGLVWDKLICENHENEVWDMSGASSATAEVTKDIQLTNIRNPCTALFVVNRFQVDVNEYLTGTAPAATVATAGSTSAVPCPRRFQAQPYTYLELREANKMFLERHTLKHVEGHVHRKYLKCENGEYIGFLPLSLAPFSERHAVGHKSLATMTNPVLRIAAVVRPGPTYSATGFGAIDPWARGFEATVTSAAGDLTSGALNHRLDVWGVVRMPYQHNRSEIIRYFL